MGSICANNFQKEQGTETIDTYKNLVQIEVKVGDHCTLSLVQGHYKQHRSDALLVFSQLKHIQHCDAVRDYCSDPDKIIQIISNMRKTFYKAPTNKSCPYKKMLICVFPTYLSQQRGQYIQQYKNMLKQAFETSKDLTLQMLNTIDGVHGLPNQMLLGVLLEELGKVRPVVKFCLISTEKKMMGMFKYELLKTQAYSIKSVLQ